MFNTALRDALATALPRAAVTPVIRAPRVHRVAAGVMPALPPKVHGNDGPRLQGGLRPRAYRSASPKWDTANKSARDPFACAAVRAEHFANKRDQ